MGISNDSAKICVLGTSSHIFIWYHISSDLMDLNPQHNGVNLAPIKVVPDARLGMVVICLKMNLGLEEIALLPKCLPELVADLCGVTALTLGLLLLCFRNPFPDLYCSILASRMRR